MKSSRNLLILFSLFLILIAAKSDKHPNNEEYRPQFHFTPEKNWMNDPNGLVYLDGEYHLFYQHNPKGNEWGYMNWGHAISTDLIHWKHMPVAITADNNSEDKEYCTAWSGSAIVDHKNVLGLQKGDTPTIVLFYTSHGCGQRIAYSTDKGRSWQKYTGNPVIPFDEKDDARDPKVFWYGPGQEYIMLLWRMPEGQKSAQGFSIYSSDNLVDWHFESHLAGFYECPDMVELPVNRHPDDTRWVVFDGDGSYMMGTFDGKHFTPQTPKFPGDYGANYYATQTFSNISSSDGRTIQMAWMRGGKYPNMPFNGQMNFPCELSLKTYTEGIRLTRTPVKEIALLREKPDSWENKNLIPGLNKNLVKGVKGDCLDIKGIFTLKSVNNFGFVVRHSKKDDGVQIQYDAKRNILSCMGKGVILTPEDGKIQLEILLDRTSIEIFGNNGKVVMSFCYTAKPDADRLVLFNTGGELLVDKLDIYPLKSMYATK
ncbi:MAG TPA: glycoside hydrolase family 32 protein [Sunxiuqinia sp.]|nr:glycoside hydrolase family 32 protein [Sunxiuqinia sp.]